MQFPPDIQLQKRLHNWSGYLIFSIVVISFLALTGWLFDIDSLKHPVSGKTAMNPVTAIGFILSGLSLRLYITNNCKKIAALAAFIVLLIGLIVLTGLVLKFDPKIDTLLFNKKLVAATINGFPNRMAPNTAFCFCLAGLTLLLFTVENKKKQKPSHYFSLFIALISIFSLLGYLYQVKTFYGFLNYIPMAAGTAICFFFFSISILFSDADKGFMKVFTSTLSGSLMTRYMIPAALVIPALLSLFRLYGNWHGLYNYEFGVALYVLSIILIFICITWYSASQLNKRELLQMQSEEAFRNSEKQVQDIFDNAPDAIVVMDSNGIIYQWNPEAESLFTWKKNETVGKTLAELIIPVQYRNPFLRGLQLYSETGKSKIVDKTSELIAQKKDGTEIDVSVRISPLTTENQLLFIVFLRDISEQKQMEIKLKSFNEDLSNKVKEKTNELTEMFERITDGFVALDNNYCYKYINKKAGKLFRQNTDSLIGKNIWEEFPFLQNSGIYAAFHESMETQQFKSNIEYYKDLDLWFENFIYPSPNGLSVYIRDISHNKKAEIEIKNVKNLADKLIDNLPGVFYFFDETGKYLRWNRKLEEVTGYSSEEIAGMNPIDFFSAEEKEYMTERINGVYEKGIHDAEAYLMTKAGDKILYYFKAVLLHYDTKPCLLGYGIDITERKNAELELKSSEQKYKLLFESNPLSMWMVKIPGYDIIDVNNMTLQQYGYTKEEFLSLSVLELRPAEDIEKFKASLHNNARGIYHAGITRHKKKDGSIIYVDIVTHDITYKGQLSRLVLAKDVTNQYFTEEKLRESYEEIRTLSSHLQNIREEERQHIAREIHDELGQLLTVLKMDVSWLNKKTAPENTFIKEKLEEIQALIDTTVKTVRRIASELRPSLLDDLGLVSAMDWYLEEFERRSGITKNFIPPETEIHLPDSMKTGLFRIFQESLTNVARHSEAKNVVVTFLQKDKKIILSITDDGIGIEEKNGGAVKTLGLLGMKERTAMMGGAYTISGKKGIGTTVTVIVPLPGTES